MTAETPLDLDAAKVTAAVDSMLNPFDATTAEQERLVIAGAERYEALVAEVHRSRDIIRRAMTFDGEQTTNGVTDKGYMSPAEWHDEQVWRILNEINDGPAADRGGTS